jgi:hypothetical protein
MITLFLGLTAFQCDRRTECCVMPPCSEKSSLTGTWKLEYFINVVKGTTEIDPQLEGKNVVFQFNDDGKEGNIEGHTFVNEVSGNYQLEPGCVIKIVAFGGTKVGEPGWSGKAWLQSNATGNYQIVGDKLTLGFIGSDEQMVFRKQ